MPGSQSPGQHFGEFENGRDGSGASRPAQRGTAPDTASVPAARLSAPALIGTDAGGFIKFSRAQKHVTSLLTASRACKPTEGGKKASEQKNF